MQAAGAQAAGEARQGEGLLIGQKTKLPVQARSKEQWQTELRLAGGRKQGLRPAWDCQRGSARAEPHACVLHAKSQLVHTHTQSSEQEPARKNRLRAAAGRAHGELRRGLLHLR